MSAKVGFIRKWYSTVPVEVVPLIAILGFAVGGATWYVSRLARGSQVVWDRRGNPYPWRDVEQDTNQKLMAVNQEFAKTWSRDKF